MINRFAFLLLLIAPLTTYAWPPNNPSAGPSLVPNAQLRLFVDYDRVSLYSEAQSRWETATAINQSVLGGIYAQPFDWLRLGAFYQIQRGVRHDADWNWSDAANSWVWTDVNSRSESLLVLDVSPRTLLPNLPGENWVGELKMRYFYNYFNQNQTLTLRPGLSYFWLREGSPFWTFFLQYEAYLPLNYGASLIYEHWIYLSALKPITKEFQLGALVSYHIQDWSSTNAFVTGTTPSSRFFVAEGSLHLGLVAVIHLGI